MAVVKTKCRACGQPIIWATTKNDKMMPIDAEPDPAGNVELHGDRGVRFARVHAGPPGMFDDWTAYMPHHATCTEWNQ